ncbi:MAG TPA: acetyl-CoA acetyltransferase [Kofleriaceae bacterium]|jgi:acetyl-CoA C-acetyltransferase|nr:acetyl-CoA acetyltransferase [Kofleriaceae bacterium]
MTAFILGGVQSDFARHLSREGHELVDLVGELVDGALAAARIEATEVQTIHVGNAFGELFAGQGHLGAMPATARGTLWGIPASRHEAACASGSVAILAAMAELAAGIYDVALVIGVEQERNVPGEQAARYLGAAAWAGHEGDGARFLWPHMFARIADAIDERDGLSRVHLDAIAAKAFANAKGNQVAQTRTWSEPKENPVVDGWLRRSDCAQVTDGGAAIVLASPRFAQAWAASRGESLDQLPRVLGWGHRTVGLPLEQKLARRGALMFPHMADAVADARRRAGRSIADIAAYEVHDCFSVTEYLAIEHLGLGDPKRAIESGQTQRTGATPINSTGGLIGGGHPVGATGVRMVVDAAHQIRGTAGAAQIPNARAIQTLNLGGSTATVVSLIVGA